MSALPLGILAISVTSFITGARPNFAVMASNKRARSS
jgi:hypothetical protein